MAILVNKSAKAPVQKAIIDLLKNHMDIPIYDHVTEGTPYPYIVVDILDEIEWGDKITPGSWLNVAIDNYAETRESLTVKEVNSKVLKVLDNDFDVEGWQVYIIKLASNENSNDNTAHWGELTLEVGVLENG